MLLPGGMAAKADEMSDDEKKVKKPVEVDYFEDIQIHKIESSRKDKL